MSSGERTKALADIDSTLQFVAARESLLEFVDFLLGTYWGGQLARHSFMVAFP